MKENTFKKITNITLSTVLTAMPVVSPLTVLADESLVEIDLDETTNSPESPSVENSPLSLETADLTTDSMNDILIDTNFNLEKLESDHADSNVVDEYLLTEENSPSEDETIDKEGEQVFDNSLPKETVSLQEEKIDSSVLESEETLHEATTHNSSFNLSEWTYTESDTSIILTKYNGSSNSIYVPGEHQGKHVIIQNFSIFPASMVNLILEEVNDKKVGLNTTSLYRAFLNNTRIKTLDLSGLDTSNVNNMDRMFYGASNLTSLNAEGWDTSKVTTLQGMFYNTKSLTTLDISNWNTSNVTTVAYMFYGATSLTTLDVSNWDTSNVTTMAYMFYGATSLNTLDVSNWDTSKVTSMYCTFYSTENLTTLDVSNWDTSNVTTMEYMFWGAKSLTSLDVSGWDTSNVTAMKSLFNQTENLTTLDVSNWDTSKVTTMEYMFYGATNLTTLDVSGWNTSKVTTMKSMFCNTTSLTTLDVSNWDTSKVTSMEYMFYWAASLTTLDVSNWDTSNVTTMAYMFSLTESLTTLDVSNWDTSSVLNMSGTFSDTYSLTTLDVSRWNTSKVTAMANMFDGTISLTSLDLNQWDTSNVTDMSWMFSWTGVTSLNIENWNTSNVTSMYQMFRDAENLISLDLNKWDTSNVEDMTCLFLRNRNLTDLKINQWDTSSVTNMSYMFEGAIRLTELDLSGWDVSNVESVYDMFNKTPKLKVLDLSGWDLLKTSPSTDMFYTEEASPLLLIAQDEKFKNYDFAGANRVGVNLSFNANNGTFADGSSVLELPDIHTIETLDEAFIDGLIKSSIEQIEVPKREVHQFEGWTPTNTVASTRLQKVFEQLNQTYTANWTSTNQAPVIEVQNQLIHAGEVFNPLDWATVQDAEDGEIVLTDSNIIKNTINSTQAGVYEVTYQVTDRHGLTTEKTIQVRVNALPVIQAQNQVIHTGNSFNPLEWVSASDIEDGEITLTKLNIIKNTINPQVAGVYEVTYQVSDSDGGVVKKTIQVRVNALPVIQTQNQVIHVGEPFEPLNWVTAYDLEDKELFLNDSNIFKNNIDSQTPGVYEVIYRVTDIDGGLTEKTIQVRVNAKPVIEAHNQILFKGEDFNPLNIVKAYDLEDGNYSSNQIHILKNDVNSMTIGVYEVTYQVVDRDGAITQKTIKVVIKDHSIIQEVETPIQIGDTFNPLEWIQTLDLLDDHIIIESLEIIENTVDTSTPGIYEIVYQGITTDGKIVLNVIQVVVKDFSLPEEDLDNPDEDIENTPPNEDSDNPNAEDDSPNIEDSKPDKEMIETGFLLDNSFWLGLISLLMGLNSLKVKKNK